MSAAPEWSRVRTLFHEAVQRPAAERARYLDQQAGQDEALRREVASLLAAHGQADGFLDSPPPPHWRRAVSQASLAPGAQFGNFEIVGPLGTGGMGEVYHARDTRLAREVAIKLLPPDLAADPDRHARFERESRLLAALNHPHIAAIHGIEEIDGRLVLVLELVEGPTLADRLATGPLPPLEALQIARDLAEALEAVHDKAVVHRDLKPANIKMSPDGAVKLLDFGLAKATPVEGDIRRTNRAGIIEPRTHDGLILGTGAYMSPEQARGQQVNKRTDIWAFGCVLFEMLSGRRAFSGETISDTIAAILDREPDWTALPSVTPPEIQTLLRRCLQKDFRRRLHDIADARVVIDDVLESPQQPNASQKTARRPSLGMIAAVVATVALTATLLAWIAPRLGERSANVPSLAYLTLELPDGTTLHSAPAVSPDGSSIAFIGHDGKASRLYVRRLSSPRIAIIPETEGAKQPFWSPDARWLAFFAGNKLKKVAIDGGAPVDICSTVEALGGSWGRGGVILFTPHLIDTPVFRVSADGGKPEPVTRLDETHGDNSHRWPAFLPDGVHFLYFVRSSEEGRRGVYIGRIDRPPDVPGERLIESEAEAQYVSLGGESAGAVITGAASGVQVQPFDPATRRLIGHPRVLDAAVGASTPYERAMVGVSPVALALAPTSIDYSNRLASASRDGSDVHVWPDLAAHNWPRLSPEGTRLVFQRVDGRRGTPDLWVKDLVRGTETRVTVPPAHALLPVWSPGGERVGFMLGRPGNVTVAVGAADGTRTVPIPGCPVARCEPSDWSPDGRSLIVTTYTAKGTDVWTIPVDASAGGQARPLIAEAFNERDARVSPDGEWVAYVSNESGRDEVSVRRISGSDRTVISATGGQQPVWRRDGAELFYVDPEGLLRAVAVKPRAGGGLTIEHPVQLAVPRIGTGHWSTQYDVSRDGRRVYYVDRAQPPRPTRIGVILGWTNLVR